MSKVLWPTNGTADKAPHITNYASGFVECIGNVKKVAIPAGDRDSESYRCASLGMNTVQVRMEPLLSGTEIGAADLAALGGPEALRRIEPSGKFAGC